MSLPMIIAGMPNDIDDPVSSRAPMLPETSATPGTVLDLLELAEGERAGGVHGARTLSRHGDLVGVVAGASGHQQVDLLGHAAHDHQREHPDGYPGDGEEDPQLSPEHVSQDLHPQLLSVHAESAAAALRRGRHFRPCASE